MPGSALHNKLLDLGCTSVIVPWGSGVIDLADPSRSITLYNGALAVNGAMRFDDFDDYIDVADHADFNTADPCTFFVRFRDGSNGMLAHYAPSSTNNFQINKSSTSGDPKVTFEVAVGGATAARQIRSTELSGAGTRNNVGCVFSGGSLTVNSNGQAVSGISQTHNVPTLNRLRLGRDNGASYTGCGIEVFAYAKAAFTADNFTELNALAIRTPAAGGGQGGA